MNDLVKEMLMQVYYLMDSGRIHDAKVLLEKILGINPDDNNNGPEAA